MEEANRHSRPALRPSELVARHRDAIRRIVAAHHARNARVFGSVSRGTDTPASDIDLLVDPTDETTLLDLGAIRSELMSLLGVEVDVLTPAALPPKIRRGVLQEAVSV